MEPDEVYANLSDKISALDGKLGDFAGRLDSLQSNSNESRFNDLKSAVDKAQADIQQINDALNAMKSGVDTLKQVNTQQTQSLDEQRKRIEDANAASEKKWADQQGLVGKLAAQAEEAGKMLANIGDTTNSIVKKAWDDGKREILNTWEDSKKDILNSLSSVTTGLIKDAKDGIKSEIQDELKSLILDDVKSIDADAKSSQPDLSDEALEARIRKIMKQVPEAA